MEAQAQAQKLAAQHVAQAALRGLQHAPPAAAMDVAVKEDIEEPTDLTLDAEEKALRMRERLEREQQQQQRHLQDEHRDREPLHQFDFRHLIPQVPIKTE